MPANWTDEKVIHLLLLVIKNHVKDASDHDLLATHLGVTRDAARIKYNLKRDFEVSDTPEANPTTLRTTPRKRKASTITKTEAVRKEGELGGGPGSSWWGKQGQEEQDSSW